MATITELKQLAGKTISVAKVFANSEDRYAIVQIEFTDGTSLSVEPSITHVGVRTTLYKDENLNTAFDDVHTPEAGCSRY